MLDWEIARGLPIFVVAVGMTFVGVMMLALGHRSGIGPYWRRWRVVEGVWLIGVGGLLGHVAFVRLTGRAPRVDHSPFSSPVILTAGWVVAGLTVVVLAMLVRGADRTGAGRERRDVS